MAHSCCWTSNSFCFERYKGMLVVFGPIIPGFIVFIYRATNHSCRWSCRAPRGPPSSIPQSSGLLSNSVDSVFGIYPNVDTFSQCAFHYPCTRRAKSLLYNEASISTNKISDCAKSIHVGFWTVVETDVSCYDVLISHCALYSQGCGKQQPYLKGMNCSLVELEGVQFSAFPN